MEGFTGTIESIDAQSRKVSVRAVTFNREMLVELDVGQISHID
jgi:transcription antitermination factor NusG